MTRASITIASVFVTVLVLLALAAGYLAGVPAVDPPAPTPTSSPVLAVEVWSARRPSRWGPAAHRSRAGSAGVDAVRGLVQPKAGPC